MLSDGHLMRHASPKLYADNFEFFVLMEGILSVKLSADITVHKIFILIIFQSTISLQPLRKEFPFFLFAIIARS